MLNMSSGLFVLKHLQSLLVLHPLFGMLEEFAGNDLYEDCRASAIAA